MNKTFKIFKKGDRVTTTDYLHRYYGLTATVISPFGIYYREGVEYQQLKLLWDNGKTTLSDNEFLIVDN